MKKLLLSYIRSFSLYKDIKSLKELSISDKRIFIELLEKDIKKHGKKGIEEIIIKLNNYQEI